MPQRLREPTLAPTRPATTGELPSLRSWLDVPEQAEAGAPARPAAPPHPAVNTLLPADGPGFYAYSAAARRFGRPETIQAVLAVAAGWQRLFPSGPRIGVGSISLSGGGPMPPHRTHQDGLDVDIRPARGDGREAPVTWRDPAYSRAATQRLVDLLLGNRVLGVQRILFNDPAITGVRAFLGHDDHLHVRFLAPTAGAARPPVPAMPATGSAAPPATGAAPRLTGGPTPAAMARPPAGMAAPPVGAAIPGPGGPRPSGPGPGAPTVPSRPASRLGLLVARWPDGRRLAYRFTWADLLVTARLVAGAGGQEGLPGGGRLVRMMLRRFARSGHRRHRSFAGFVRATVPSETLVSGEWRQLPHAARRAALRVLLGRDPAMARGTVRVRPPRPPGG